MGEKTIIIISFIIFNIVFIVFVGAIIAFVRQYRIKKRIHLAQIQNKEELHKKELLETQVEIQSQTMKHIGREIHDNVGQKLTLSSLYLQQLVFENKAPQIADNINNVNTIINESLDELRNLSKSLTDDTIENSSIIALIEKECEKVRELKQCTVVFENNLKADITSYQAKSILLRIVQEFIQNSIKHAHCKKIRISLSNLQNELQLMLKDDGQGFDATVKSQGIGLKNIEKRVEILMGTSTLESNRNGTKLTIKIPL